MFGKYHDRKEGEAPFVFVAPKSKNSIRDVDMSPELRRLLRELYLASPKKGLVFSVLKKADEERAKKNLPAIGKVRWHDLRHTFGSLKIDQGENIYYVMRQMGHSSSQVTIDTYTHQLKDKNPEAAVKGLFRLDAGDNCIVSLIFVCFLRFKIAFHIKRITQP